MGVIVLRRLLEHYGALGGSALGAPLCSNTLGGTISPIPWTIWKESRAITTREASFSLTVPVAEYFPLGARWYGRWFDELQIWLIRDHAIGKRHREHAIFRDFMASLLPERRLLDPVWHREHRVIHEGSVGVVGWMLARADVIDVRGLNDYVIARNPVPPRKSRRMAHDRKPPVGYLPCFRPNLMLGPGGVMQRPRKSPLRDRDIERCEREWRAHVRRLPGSG